MSIQEFRALDAAVTSMTASPFDLEVVMIRNMGTADRAARVVLGLVVVTALFGLGWSFFGSIIGSVLVVVAALMFTTATLGYCPTYRLLGVSTDPALHRVARAGAKVGAHH